MYSEECLGENPEGFPTQRAALEEEDQLRRVGGISSHALFLPRCGSLVQVLRVTLNAVCMRDEGSFPRIDPSVGYKSSALSTSSVPLSCQRLSLRLLRVLLETCASQTRFTV